MRPYRKLLSAFVLAASILYLWPGQGPWAAEDRLKAENADIPADYTIADAFQDEELVYNIGFWFLDGVALGKVTLKKSDDGEYIATLTAYTTGAVVDWVLRHRKDVYMAHMRMSPDGKRFVTTRFEKTVNIGGKVRRSVSNFDYEKRVMTWKSWKDGKEERSGEAQIPKGIYCDDPLSAFYNFRFGVYGPIIEGKEYRIYTFPKEDHVPQIYLRVAKREEKDRRIRDTNIQADYFAEIKLDKELFGSKAGDIEILFTRDMMPVEAVAKEILFFGDVRGKLTQVGINIGFDNEGGVRLISDPPGE